MTFDYETIDYASADLYSILDTYSFTDENENISDLYSRAKNKKLGFSFSIQDMSFRGGYSTFGSPFKNNLDDGSREYISAGIGFKTGSYSFDISMTHHVQNEDYIVYPETLNNHEFANIKNEGNMIIATCNYKF